MYVHCVLWSEMEIGEQDATLYVFTSGRDLHLASHLQVHDVKYGGGEYAKTTLYNLDSLRSLQDYSVHLFLAVYRCLTW
jgi:hypothetical protein